MLDGDRKAAEAWVNDWYGQAGRIERHHDQTVFRHVGFWVSVF